MENFKHSYTQYQSLQDRLKRLTQGQNTHFQSIKNNQQAQQFIDISNIHQFRKDKNLYTHRKSKSTLNIQAAIQPTAQVVRCIRKDDNSNKNHLNLNGTQVKQTNRFPTSRPVYQNITINAIMSQKNEFIGITSRNSPKQTKRSSVFQHQSFLKKGYNFSSTSKQLQKNDQNENEHIFINNKKVKVIKRQNIEKQNIQQKQFIRSRTNSKQNMNKHYLIKQRNRNKTNQLTLKDQSEQIDQLIKKIRLSIDDQFQQQNDSNKYAKQIKSTKSSISGISGQSSSYKQNKFGLKDYQKQNDINSLYKYNQNLHPRQIYAFSKYKKCETQNKIKCLTQNKIKPEIQIKFKREIQNKLNYERQDKIKFLDEVKQEKSQIKYQKQLIKCKGGMINKLKIAGKIYKNK